MSEEGGAEGGGGGGGNKMIIIIIAVVILLILGGAAAWFFLMSGNKEEDKEEVKIEQSEGVTEPILEPKFLNLGTFTSNLKDGRRFLRVSIQLLITEQPVVDYLTKRQVEVKDIVLSRLQELSSTDAKSGERRNQLKDDLINRIERLFPKERDWEDNHPIRKVLFEEFVVQ